MPTGTPAAASRYEALNDCLRFRDTAPLWAHLGHRDNGTAGSHAATHPTDTRRVPAFAGQLVHARGGKHNTTAVRSELCTDESCRQERPAADPSNGRAAATRALRVSVGHTVRIRQGITLTAASSIAGVKTSAMVLVALTVRGCGEQVPPVAGDVSKHREPAVGLVSGFGEGLDAARPHPLIDGIEVVDPQEEPE